MYLAAMVSQTKEPLESCSTALSLSLAKIISEKNMKGFHSVTGGVTKVLTICEMQDRQDRTSC